MKTLYLTLTKEWFKRHLEDKPEDYRAVTAYWLTRLYQHKSGHTIDKKLAEYWISVWSTEADRILCDEIEPRKFDVAQASNGYSTNAPMFRKAYKTVEYGVGNPIWGAPREPVFILKLGKVLETKNCERL